jgi:hypothetical protein
LKSGQVTTRVAGVTNAAAAYTASGKIEFTGFEVAGVWFPMAKTWGEGGLFLKAGLHNTEQSGTFTVTGIGGTASVSSKESGTGTLFGAGFDWDFSQQGFLRFSVTRYQKVGGQSGNDGTVYSVGIGANF